MKIALLIPCHNEAKTIGGVIEDFRKEIPQASIYVYDNNSTDETSRIAREHQAEVRFSPRSGKGMVIRQMFDEVTADIYITVDGDGTYQAGDVHQLLKPVVSDECDMCVGNRLIKYSPGSFPPLHVFGNKLISFLTRKFYGERIDDMLSGFRVMNRKLVEKLCLISVGFEIETEINIKSIWHGFRIRCVPIDYSGRPRGSSSKIRTLSDGYRILATLFMLLREYQPVTMGGISFLVLVLAGLIMIAIGGGRGNYFLFSAGLTLVLLGSVILCTGVILHAINMADREAAEAREKLRRIFRNLKSG
jgi:glycosyltransferase involved in cell wall biosynthesis